ncbi:Lsr2 family DNA-binding protein [Aeromicrobium wangtongii]|uniref:Lsr2 family DNA-binding protein n=1 Tax=Aeromicrobium wangtongii TaxID=2969247 RepID=UPI00201769A7|nr:histone-like nucleoid-structuring protein Lsr2 [Aeromicrobium wangtongii]MCL3818858.1 Lsr2 family protein [Aeromicrobium wangtongii]
MPKREIVPDPIITVIDDYDGKELPPDTPSERYLLRGRTYDLYLSKESKKAVDSFLDQLVDGAQEVRDTSPPSQRRRRGNGGVRIRDGFTIHDLREWARANGHEVSDNRRAPTKVIEAFNDAHSSSR